MKILRKFLPQGWEDNINLLYKKSGFLLFTLGLIISVVSFLLVNLNTETDNKIEIVSKYLEKDNLFEEVLAVEEVIKIMLENEILRSGDLIQIPMQQKFETPNRNSIEVNLFQNDSCINLRALVYNTSNNKTLRNKFEIDRIKKIFSKLSIDPTIVENIVDWQDSDLLTIDGQEEKNLYKLYDFSPKNYPLHNMFELKMVSGLNRKNFEIIKSFFCVNQNYKTNIHSLDKNKISLFLPFLNNAQVEILLSKLQLKKLKNKNELLTLLERIKKNPLSNKEKRHLNLFGFANKSILGQVKINSKDEKEWMTNIKFELIDNKGIKIMYRLGPYSI